MSAPPARSRPSRRSRTSSGSAISAWSGGSTIARPPASWIAATYERAMRKASWSQTPHRARSTAAQMPITGRAIADPGYPTPRRARARPHRGGDRGGSVRAVALERRPDRLAVDPARAQDPARDALALAREAEQQMLGADVVVAHRDRLAQRQLERLLRARRERERAARHEPAAATAPCERAGAERALDPLADGVEVDAERGERLGVEVGLAAADDPVDLAAGPRGVDGEVAQHAGGPAVVVVEEGEEQVLGADPAVGQGGRLALGGDDRVPGVVGEALEHHDPLRRSRPPPCLRWTACLETPSAPPISCHDHPCARAWATWSASRRSTSVRRDATARSPTAGSVLSTDSASLIASCALMAVNIR